MNDTNIPVQSLKTLIICMISAVFLAAFILVAIVGPAEYGIDPTGIGKALGLTVLAKPLQQQAKSVVSCPAGGQSGDWQDIVVITVPGGSGLEYKFDLKKNDELAYEWTADGSKLYFDFHGEPEGDTTGYFKSFKEATDSRSDGVLTAPFTGTHGWYWENKTQWPVQVTLKTRGKYKVKGLM